MAPSKGLHDRLNRISHWDVNVSDLERSRAWYEATTPLRVFARTKASQEFPGLNITEGSFEGYLMKDRTLPIGYPMIHLVQWKTPHPVGKPYLSHTNVGWFRIVLSVPLIEEARQAVLRQGSEPFTPATKSALRLSPSLPELDYQVFTVHDPDGVAVEFVDIATPRSMGPSTVCAAPNTVAHNTARLESSIGFYTDVLGLDFMYGMQTEGQVPNVYSPVGETTGFTGAFFAMRGSGSCFFDWLQWRESPEYPTPYREPYHLGVVRCAIEVDDVEAAYQILKERSRAHGYDIFLSEPEVWDLGSDLGARKVVNFQDPEGVAFQLVQQQGPSVVSLHPWGRGAELV